MNEVQLFQNEQFGQVRVVMRDNEPWFMAADVCKVLGYSNPWDAVKKHIEDNEKDDLAIRDAIGREQKSTAISESGLYALIFSSRLPKAKEFRIWVTSEVLPSIRKTGSYGIQSVENILANPDTMIKILTEYKKEKEARIAAEQQIEQDKPKVVLANAITASTNSILVRDLAKIIKQNGYDTGEKRLYNWLREMGYLIKKRGMDHNRPTQASMNKGLFEVKESTVENEDGSILTKFTTLVTGKGQMYFINKFKEWAEIENKDN